MGVFFWSMGDDILHLEVDFGSLGLCERLLGVWEPNWNLLLSILALRGKLRLLSLNICLMELIVGHWESICGVSGSTVGLVESILGLYESILSLWAGGRDLVS